LHPQAQAEPGSHQARKHSFGYSTVTEIYARLNVEMIHPKHVVIGKVNDAVLDYLSSHSGLEALELCSIYFQDENESHALGDRFYKSVLPKHIDSIQELKIQSSYEGRWCYDVDYVSVLLAQCKNLRCLSVTLNSAAVIMANQPSTIQTPAHPLDHVYTNNFDNVVCFADDSRFL
jgi:hypothetical protein